MSPLDSSMLDAVAGGFIDPDRLPFPRLEIPPDHPMTPTCPVFRPPPES